ncbi:XRE family transcriptional regulator [Streptomyces sp. NPDC004579]|uniref:XRE family transcriptional regulator n=1 Tax=Streptomyces sp. NPDC004579 TaxID=3154667 RepID=UPI0033BAAEC6
MADTYALLADTRARLANATSRRADRLSDAFTAEEIAQLSYETGIPQPLVIELLNGGRAPQTSTSDRVCQRLGFLRDTRRHENGRKFTQVELSKVAGVSRPTLNTWLSNVVPPMEGAERLRCHFGVPPGFLTATEPEALAEALKPKLQAVEPKLQAAEEVIGSLPPELQESEDLQRLALRGSQMDPADLKNFLNFLEWADTVGTRRDRD